MTEVLLSVGSNIDRAHNISSALRELDALLDEMTASRVYESEAVGFKGDNFYNLVVRGFTEQDLKTISGRLKRIEDAHGRERSAPRLSGRTLDIDIVLFGDLVGCVHGIELPRPELYTNAFVLKPLADLMPERVDPATGKTFLELWQTADIRQKLWMVRPEEMAGSSDS
jgi:2-amino-4-hydroxy-6-hydroxymethyldihydropteridine diphosphokinase